MEGSNRRDSFLRVLEARSQRSRCRQTRLLVTPPPGCRPTFLFILSLFYKGSSPVGPEPLPRTSLDLFTKSSHTAGGGGLGLQHRNLGGRLPEWLCGAPTPRSESVSLATLGCRVDTGGCSPNLDLLFAFLCSPGMPSPPPTPRCLSLELPLGSPAAQHHLLPAARTTPASGRPVPALSTGLLAAPGQAQAPLRCRWLGVPPAHRPAHTPPSASSCPICERPFGAKPFETCRSVFSAVS